MSIFDTPLDGPRSILWDLIKDVASRLDVLPVWTERSVVLCDAGYHGTTIFCRVTILEDGYLRLEGRNPDGKRRRLTCQAGEVAQRLMDLGNGDGWGS